MTRTFDLKPAVRSRVPLLLGIVGASSSGKTYSALRLATGMAKVLGGPIAFIDTEHGRALHYADKFAFHHMPFEPPHGPLDYSMAIETAVKAGAKVLVIDSMTHEHSGEGGVLDQIEKYLDDKAGDDWKRRDQLKFTAQIRPKAQRKKLNNYIVQSGISAVMCYRAVDKIKPVRGKEPEHLGWMPETTSTLHYEMTQRFLLTPGCDGVPKFFPDNEAERLMVKNPAQFRDFYQDGQRLDEELGQRLAEWAAGVKPADQPAADPVADLAARFNDLRTPADVAALEAALSADKSRLWKSLGKVGQARVTAAIDAAKKRTTVAPAPAADLDEHGVPIGPPTDQHPGQLFDGGNDAMTH